MLPAALWILGALLLIGPGLATAQQTAANPRDMAVGGDEPDRPRRIISLDHCADQFVLKLADKEHILALSPDATAAFSYLRDEAVGLPTVRPVAEDAIILQPDLIVRSYGGGPNAARWFARAGLPVLDLPFASDLDSIRHSITLVAKRLGVPRRGQALIAAMEQRLQQLRPARGQQTVLYMTPGGVTTGPGSLVHELLQLAGLVNYQQQPGWRPLPLERLVHESPDAIATAFYDSDIQYLHAWSPGRHPVARNQLQHRPVIALEGTWTACNGWFVLDAIEALAQGVEDLPVGRAPP